MAYVKTTPLLLSVLIVVVFSTGCVMHWQVPGERITMSGPVQPVQPFEGRHYKVDYLDETIALRLLPEFDRKVWEAIKQEEANLHLVSGWWIVNRDTLIYEATFYGGAIPVLGQMKIYVNWNHRTIDITEERENKRSSKYAAAIACSLESILRAHASDAEYMRTTIHADRYSYVGPFGP